MPFDTDERLKSYLDTNQLARERLCCAVLALDNRFAEVNPRHPRGGPDGGRDIEAVFRQEQRAFGAVGFVNQANDSNEQKKKIQRKFGDDLERALVAAPEVFVFLTNINLTISEKAELVSEAKARGLGHAEIIDRERIRITLDSPDGFAARFQYLDISMSEEEQASFFSKWGDDIQSLVATGFQRLEGTLERLLFLQEARDVVPTLLVVLELRASYPAEQIGHFRAFCSLYLKEVRHGIVKILFGSTDKHDRLRTDISSAEKGSREGGIKLGVSGGQWERRIDLDRRDLGERGTNQEDEDGSELISTGSSSGIGADSVRRIPIKFNNGGFIRVEPRLSLRDLDEAMFVLILNESLAEKVRGVHLFGGGYKVMQVMGDELHVDRSYFEPEIPAEFTSSELADPWVRIRAKGASFFRISFFEQTPMRMANPRKTEHEDWVNP